MEELGAEYIFHPINIRAGEQKTREFLALNPNGKVPVIVDADGPGGAPITITESAAILHPLLRVRHRRLPRRVRDGGPHSRTFSDASEPTSTSVALAAQPPQAHWLTRNVLIVAATFFLLGTEFFGYTSLYATYLYNELRFSIADAGTSLGMYGLGAVGGLAGGWLGDRLGRTGVFAGLAILAAARSLTSAGCLACRSTSASCRIQARGRS